MSDRNHGVVLFLAAIFFGIGVFPGPGFGEEPYPTKPITMVIDYAAGGMIDNVT